MSGAVPPVFENRTAVAGALDAQAIAIGGGIGAFFGLLALMLPIFGVLTGGLVAGFFVAYALRGVRGAIHGMMAGGVAGVLGGGLTAITGMVVHGLYLEPPSLVWDLVASGPVSPMFTHSSLESVLIAVAVALIIFADAVLGAGIGVGARWVADQIRSDGE